MSVTRLLERAGLALARDLFAVSAAPSDGVAALASGRGVTTEIETWPRPLTTPEMVRLDCRFITLTTSPSVPFSSALPRGRDKPDVS